MQRHKTVLWVILLTLSVINFVLAAPVSEWGIREVRVDVVDVAEDVATTSQKRWKPLDIWRTNAELEDRMETPHGRELSGPDYRLEHEPRPHSSRSPMDPNLSPRPGSDSDNSLPLPVDPPLPVQNGHASPPSPVQNGHASPQSSQELIDGPILSSYSAGSSTHSGSHSSTESSSSSWTVTAYEEWAAAQSQSSSPLHDSSPPGQPDYQDLLNVFNHRHPPDPGLRELVGAWSDPAWHWPYPPISGHPQSDPGPPRRPHSPTNSEQSTGAYPPPDSPTASSSNSEHESLDRPARSRWSNPAGGLWPYSPLPAVSGLPHSDPGPPRGPFFPSNSEQSTGAYPPPDPSTPHPPSPEPLQQESENILGELFRDSRAKRHISDSRSVDAAQGLQGTPDFREYVSASAFPLPPTFQFP